MTTPTVTQPWITRLHTFASRLPRKDAPQLAEDLATLRDELDETSTLITELVEQLEQWADDDADRADRADAKESADELVNQLEEALVGLRTALGDPPSAGEQHG